MPNVSGFCAITGIGAHTANRLNRRTTASTEKTLERIIGYPSFFKVSLKTGLLDYSWLAASVDNIAFSAF
jgi:hypothetical protein